MTESSLTRLVAASAVAALLGTSACSGGGGGSASVLVTYEASSTDGADIEVTYETAEGELTEIVSSPWTFDLERSGAFDARLQVRNLELDGGVRCDVRPGDLRPVAADGEARATCLVSVSSSGNSTSINASSSGEPFMRNADGEAVAVPANQPEPQTAEADSVVAIDDRRFLLSGHDGVHLLDTSDGSVELVEGSNRFGNPLDVAIDDDGNVYAIDIFKDHLQVIRPGEDTTPVELAEWPDDSPGELLFFDGRLFVLLASPDVLVALDTDGTELWRAEVGHDGTPSTLAAIAEGQVAVAVSDIAMVGFDVATGDRTFEWDLMDPVESITRRDGEVYFSFADGRDNSTVVLPEGAAERQDASDAREFPGYNVVFDPSGVPFADAGGRIHRIDPTTMTVDRTIEVAGRLLAVGDDALFIAERTSGAGDRVSISQLPVSLFD